MPGNNFILFVEPLHGSISKPVYFPLAAPMTILINPPSG